MPQSFDGVFIRIQLADLFISWANTESLFNAVLESLLGTTHERAATVFLSHRSTKPRLDLILALSHERLQPQRQQELQAFAKRFRKLSDSRNYFAHCIYIGDQDGKLAATSGARMTPDEGMYKVEEKIFDAATMNEIKVSIEGLMRLSLDLREWVNGLNAALGLPPLENPSMPVPKRIPRSPRTPPSTTEPPVAPRARQPQKSRE